MTTITTTSNSIQPEITFRWCRTVRCQAQEVWLVLTSVTGTQVCLTWQPHLGWYEAPPTPVPCGLHTGFIHARGKGEREWPVDAFHVSPHRAAVELFVSEDSSGPFLGHAPDLRRRYVQPSPHARRWVSSAALLSGAGSSPPQSARHEWSDASRGRTRRGSLTRGCASASLGDLRPLPAATPSPAFSRAFRVAADLSRTSSRLLPGLSSGSSGVCLIGEETGSPPRHGHHHLYHHHYLRSSTSPSPDSEDALSERRDRLPRARRRQLQSGLSCDEVEVEAALSAARTSSLRTEAALLRLDALAQERRVARLLAESDSDSDFEEEEECGGGGGVGRGRVPEPQYGCVITFESRSSSLQDVGSPRALEDALVSLTSTDSHPEFTFEGNRSSGPPSLGGESGGVRVCLEPPTIVPRRQAWTTSVSPDLAEDQNFLYESLSHNEHRLPLQLAGLDSEDSMDSPRRHPPPSPPSSPLHSAASGTSGHYSPHQVTPPSPFPLAPSESLSPPLVSLESYEPTVREVVMVPPRLGSLSSEEIPSTEVGRGSVVTPGVVVEEVEADMTEGSMEAGGEGTVLEPPDEDLSDEEDLDVIPAGQDEATTTTADQHGNITSTTTITMPPPSPPPSPDAPNNTTTMSSLLPLSPPFPDMSTTTLPPLPPSPDAPSNTTMTSPLLPLSPPQPQPQPQPQPDPILHTITEGEDAIHEDIITTLADGEDKYLTTTTTTTTITTITTTIPGVMRDSQDPTTTNTNTTSFDTTATTTTTTTIATTSDTTTTTTTTTTSSDTATTVPREPRTIPGVVGFKTIAFDPEYEGETSGSVEGPSRDRGRGGGGGRGVSEDEKGPSRGGGRGQTEGEGRQSQIGRGGGGGGQRESGRGVGSRIGRRGGGGGGGDGHDDEDGKDFRPTPLRRGRSVPESQGHHNAFTQTPAIPRTSQGTSTTARKATTPQNQTTTGEHTTSPAPSPTRTQPRLHRTRVQTDTSYTPLPDRLSGPWSHRSRPTTAPPLHTPSPARSVLATLQQSLYTKILQRNTSQDTANILLNSLRLKDHQIRTSAARSYTTPPLHHHTLPHYHYKRSSSPSPSSSPLPAPPKYPVLRPESVLSSTCLTAAAQHHLRGSTGDLYGYQHYPAHHYTHGIKVRGSSSLPDLHDAPPSPHSYASSLRHPRHAHSARDVMYSSSLRERRWSSWRGGGGGGESDSGGSTDSLIDEADHITNSTAAPLEFLAGPRAYEFSAERQHRRRHKRQSRRRTRSHQGTFASWRGDATTATTTLSPGRPYLPYRGDQLSPGQQVKVLAPGGGVAVARVVTYQRGDRTSKPHHHEAEDTVTVVLMCEPNRLQGSVITVPLEKVLLAWPRN